MNFLEGIIGQNKQADAGQQPGGDPRAASAQQQNAAAGGNQGSGWLSRVGQGIMGGGEAEEDNFITSMKHLDSLANKNIIVTGGTGGIGSEVVSELVKHCGHMILLL
jgi:hypothetical protein